MDKHFRNKFIFPLYAAGHFSEEVILFLQTRVDLMQLLVNAHKEPTEEKQEDKEHDKEFKEMHKGVTKRGEYRLHSVNDK